jgi:hypothetical protein
MGPWFMPPNFFDFLFEFAEIFKFESDSAGIIPCRTKIHFKDRGSLNMDTISLG